MNIKDYKGQVVWIIGASSGIGAALAANLAQQGARVAVSARREEALKQVADESKAEWYLALDINDLSSIESAQNSLINQAGRIDRIIFLSAIYTPMQLDNLDISEVTKVVQTNLLGTFNLIKVSYPYLLGNKSGQLALCGSISGYLGLPFSQPYAATKAALINLTESLQAESIGTGIDIKVINPGFVKTPLTDKNDFAMPFIMEVDNAAQRVARGLCKKGFEVRFPRRFAMSLKGFARLPYWLKLRLMKSTVIKEKPKL